MESKALNDFKGGFVARRGSTEFKEDQWAALYGFVIEDSGALRSQWALQKVAGLSDVVAVDTYAGHSGAQYLIAVTSTGAIKWCVAPAAMLSSDDAGLTPTWNDLENADLSVPTDSGDVTSRRPICKVPLRSESTAGFRSGVLFNSPSIADGSSSFVVYENDAGTDLRFVETLDHWPNATSDTAIPKARVGTMWNGVLVLGDTFWKHDSGAALDSSNDKRYLNGLFLSQPGNPFSFDPDDFLFIGDGHAVISNLIVVDAGLLVLTTRPATGMGGVYLLRGTPGRYTLETIREGVGASIHSACYWEHTATACWITEYGEIWQSDGRNVVRLDYEDLGLDDRDGTLDGCGAFGPYLLASREGRILCLRALGDEQQGAWTELALDEIATHDLRFGGMMQDCFYFLGTDSGASRQVWRWVMPQQTDGESERGSGTLGPITLNVQTRTLEGDDGHQKTFWRGLGIRATAGSTDPEDATLVSATLYAGPTRDSTSPSVSRSINLDLAPAAERLRGDVQVRGIGPSREFAAKVTFTGDVIVEQVTPMFDSATPSHSTEGT